MTTTMYDSTNPFDIPITAGMVAGYVNGIYAWSPAGWARFAGKVQWRISITAAANAGNVLDVETGDATPAQAPAWVVMRRLAGVDPIIYVQASTWRAVQLVFAASGVPPPHWWIANYDGNPAIPAGAIAKQYANQAIIPGHPHYDLSSVDAQFGSGGGTITTPLTTRRTTILAGTASLHQFVRGGGDALYHRRCSAGTWSPWAGLGGTLTSDVISGGVDDQGTLRVTVVGAGGELYDISSSDDGVTWSPYSNNHGVGTGLVTLGGGGVASTAPAPPETEPKSVTGTFTGTLS